MELYTCHLLQCRIVPAIYQSYLHTTTLQDLSTRGVWLQGKSKEGFRDEFYESLRQMDRLKQLKTPYIADDQMLRIVTANCPHLTLLDLSGAMELTDSGVSKW